MKGQFQVLGPVLRLLKVGAGARAVQGRVALQAQLVVQVRGGIGANIIQLIQVTFTPRQVPEAGLLQQALAIGEAVGGRGVVQPAGQRSLDRRQGLRCSDWRGVKQIGRVGE